MCAFLSVLDIASDDRTDDIVKDVAEMELYCAESNNEKVGETLSHVSADSGLLVIVMGLWSSSLEVNWLPSHFDILKGPPLRNGQTFVG